VLAYLNSDDVYYEGAVAAAVEAFERDPARTSSTATRSTSTLTIA